MDRKKRKSGNEDNSRGAGGAISIIGTALIVIVILLCSMLVVPGMFGFHMYNVISGSMEPALKAGSLIYVYKEDPADVENKDIIAFYSSLEDGGIITHRVVENHVSSGTFQTKGDANAREDPALISYDNYIGSVKLALPYMGKLFTILTSIYGKLAAACVVGLGVILNLAGSCWKEDYEEEE